MQMPSIDQTLGDEVLDIRDRNTINELYKNWDRLKNSFAIGLTKLISKSETDNENTIPLIFTGKSEYITRLMIEYLVDAANESGQIQPNKHYILYVPATSDKIYSNDVPEIFQRFWEKNKSLFSPYKKVLFIDEAIFHGGKTDMILKQGRNLKDSLSIPKVEYFGLINVGYRYKNKDNYGTDAGDLWEIMRSLESILDSHINSQDTQEQDYFKLMVVISLINSVVETACQLCREQGILVPGSYSQVIYDTN